MRYNPLLRDLAALIKRYPAREWSQLAVFLEDDRNRAQLVAFLKNAAVVSKKLSPSTKTKTKTLPFEKRKSPSRVLGDLEAIEVNLSRTPMVELRNIANRYGVIFSNKDSRGRIAKRILRKISERASKISPDKSTTFKKSDRGDYGQWADIIMGVRPKVPKPF